jgi:DNA-binding CsgD family transcriptional regulator
MGNGCDAYTSPDFAHGVTPELLASRRDFWESLSELLSPRQYVCLTRAIDGESQQCIADSLGITQQAVAKAFASAIAKIRSSGSLIDDLQAIVTQQQGSEPRELRLVAVGDGVLPGAEHSRGGGCWGEGTRDDS